MRTTDKCDRTAGCNTRRLLLTGLLLCATVAIAQGGTATSAIQNEDEIPPRKADAALSAEPAARTGSPTLVREQLQTYDKLQRIWSNREVPDGMKLPRSPFEPRNSGARAVSLLADNVELHLGAGIGYYVDHMEAALVPTNKGTPVDLDDPWSYKIHIFRGRIRLRPEQIDALLNHYALTFRPRAIVEVENFTHKDKLKIEVGARLWKVLPPIGTLPVTLVGTPKVTKDDRIVYKPQQVTSLGLPLLPLLTAINVPLSTLTPLQRPGVVLNGNKLYMDPEKLFPPPRIEIDNLNDVEVTNKGLILSFNSDINPDFSKPPVEADSYVWLQSGDVQFFDVLLVNIHLEIIHAAGNKPLEFNLYHYRPQAAAGRIVMNRNGALIAKVPNDFPIDTVSSRYPNKPRESTR